MKTTITRTKEPTTLKMKTNASSFHDMTSMKWTPMITNIKSTMPISTIFTTTITTTEITTTKLGK